MRRIARIVLAAVCSCALGAAACDRAIEPFDPNEKVEQPDLSKIFPEGAERAAKAEAQQGAPPEPTRGAMPPGAPPAPPQADGDAITGTVRLAPELAGRVPAGAVLFLMARTGEAGPPVAVVRIADPEFPFEFSIGPDDRMIEAMPFAGPFTLSARIDADRNAMTRTPGDLQGQAAGRVAAGAEDVELVIDEIL
jgi:cytochrome c-type biogenesis protein CcmH